MSIWKPLRIAYIKTTNFTHGYQGKDTSKINDFYKLWSKFYDLSIYLDPAYQRELDNMIESVVFQNDLTADLGCGTGLSSIHAGIFAKKVVAIDPSIDMTNILSKKLQKKSIENIEIRTGYFPNVLKSGEVFDSIISSFMFAHLTGELRSKIVADIFNNLNSNGRFGLFSARGEVAPSFETKDEIKDYLLNAGFKDIQINDVSDIYRITTAKKK